MTRIPVALIVTLALALPLSAQSPDGPGRAPLGSYFDSGIDNINLFNGNLMVNSPLFSIPGRELNTSVGLSYNSQGWRTGDTGSGTYGYYDGGWTITESHPSSPEIKFQEHV
jgi:hypothetical protein